MRVVTVVGVLLIGGAATVSAQHARQLEFGAFGSYTRYDRAFQLNNKLDSWRRLGVGGRIGYFLNDYVGIEVDANIAEPTYLVTGDTTTAVFGSASLVLNSGGGGSVLYVLGGYSRLHFGPTGAVTSDLNAVHGGVGERIFFGNHIALRLEARAYYRPGSTSPTGLWVGHVTGSAGLSFFLGGGAKEAAPPPIPKERRDSILAAGGQVPEAPPAPPAPRGGPTYERRASDWNHKWYWGAQGGLLVFKTNFESLSFEPTFGGHWLITGRRTALYVSYEQSLFLSDRHTTFVEPDGSVTPGNVSFHDLRRIMIGVLAFPAQKRVEPFGGIGFAIMEALNVEASCASCTTASQFAAMQDAADEAASKAFFFWMGGIDVKQGRLALYGHYVLTSSARGFIIQGTTHTFQGGIRYSLGSAKEGVSER